MSTTKKIDIDIPDLSSTKLRDLAVEVLNELHRRDQLSVDIPLTGQLHGTPPAPVLVCCSDGDIEAIFPNGPMVDIMLRTKFSKASRRSSTMQTSKRKTTAKKARKK